MSQTTRWFSVQTLQLFPLLTQDIRATKRQFEDTSSGCCCFNRVLEGFVANHARRSTTANLIVHRFHLRAEYLKNPNRPRRPGQLRKHWGRPTKNDMDQQPQDALKKVDAVKDSTGQASSLSSRHCPVNRPSSLQSIRPTVSFSSLFGDRRTASISSSTRP